MSWLQKERQSQLSIVENRLNIMIEIERFLCQKRIFMIKLKELKRTTPNITWLCLLMRSMFQNGLGIWRKSVRFQESKKRSDNIRIHLVSFFQWTIWIWLKSSTMREVSGAKEETLLLRRPKVSYLKRRLIRTTITSFQLTSLLMIFPNIWEIMNSSIIPINYI